MKRWNTKQKKELEVPEIDLFLEKVIELSKYHGLSIAHEDGHGNFIIQKYDRGLSDWLMEADDAREGY